MEKTRPGQFNSSTYGQACAQCYRAKCRCVPGHGGGACERCLRLRKDCHPSDSARRRIVQRADESDKRIAQLEDKIETLLSAMQPATNSSAPSANIGQLLNQGTTSSSTLGSVGLPENSVSTASSSEGPTPLTDTSPTAQPAAYPLSPCLSDISPRQAEDRLEFFRSRMLPSFPFIHLGPDISAWQLHHDRPFLFHAIITITTFSTTKRLPLADSFKELLCNSVMINVQSSIDLLLGLLTYLAWSTDAFLGRADLVSRLMMIATSLIFDLRLFKPTPPDVNLIMAITQGQAYDGQNADEHIIQDLIEKQRALLACFILSSNISSHLGRQDALRWTPRMQEALCVIEMNKSCPTDEAFAFQVRLNLLKQRAAYIREQHEMDRMHTATASAMSSLPGLLYLKTLRSQLRELQASFPASLYQRNVIVAYAQYVELYINQLAYSISWDSPPLNISGPRSDGGLLPGFERLQCLWHSVENIKSWLDNFYQIQPSDLASLPFHFWSQMIVCVTILKYLSVLSDPSWDRQAVRNKINFLSTMDGMCQQLDLGSGGSGLHGDDNLLMLLRKMLFRCREWADAWWNKAPFAPDEEALPQRSGTDKSSSNDYSIPDLDGMIMVQSIDLENDQWLEDLLEGFRSHS